MGDYHIKTPNQKIIMSKLSRRDFLKLFTATAFSSLVPPHFVPLRSHNDQLPQLEIDQLPEFIQEILQLTPKTIFGKDGYLAKVNDGDSANSIVLQRRTDWNLQNTQPYNQLKADKPWGIVLHWFGDKYPQPQDIDFYMRGFNGKKIIDGFTITTSAHFLVGDFPVNTNPTNKTVGIVQIQKPNPEGIPYQAAHISFLDHAAYQEGRQYFISALNKLTLENPGVRFLIQDFYDQPLILAHKQTIGIEITGHSFEDPRFYPTPQKIANVLSVVWAVMKRYSIPAKDIMGHLELQLNKPDPGKKFLALIKYLIGIKALIENDEEMNSLVFDPFVGAIGDNNPVLTYFKFIRDYLLLTTSPEQIYEWDAWSKFLMSYDAIQGLLTEQFLAKEYYYPLQEPFWQPGNKFLEPANHEGVDFYPGFNEFLRDDLEINIHLIANGTCIYFGEAVGIHDGQLAIFKHRQKDGSETISYYGHLKSIRNLKVGERYPGGWIIGSIRNPQDPPYGFLHFSLAFGPSWEIYLNQNPNIPLNAGSAWIITYFLDPIIYLSERNAQIYDPLKGIRIKPR